MAEIVPPGQEPKKRPSNNPLPLLQEAPNKEFWDTRAADYAPASTSEVLRRTWESTMEDTPVAMLGQKSAIGIIDEMPGQRTLSVAELNAKYLGSNITWTEPKKEAVADYIVEANKNQQMMQNRMSLGEGGFVEGALGFGTTAVRHLMDPINFAGNVAIGAAIKAAPFMPALLRGSGVGSSLSRGFQEIEIFKEISL